MDEISKRLAAIEKGIGEIKKSMSTKGDLEALETGLKSNMQDLESGLKGDMKTLESGLKGDMKVIESGMKALEVRLTERIEEAQMEIMALVG